LLALLGMLLSGYALYVEHKVSSRKAALAAGIADESSEEFVALCDLGSWASCSDVLTSEASHMFGPPNALLGFLFYCAILIYPTFTFIPFRETLFLAATAFSCLLTFYLGATLYKMGDFCVLCVSTYVINWALLYVAWREVKYKKGVTTTKKEL